MHFSLIFHKFSTFFINFLPRGVRFWRSKVGRKLHSINTNNSRRMTADFFFSGAITVLGYSKCNDLVHFRFWSLFFKIFQFIPNIYNFLKKVDFYVSFCKNRIFSSFLLEFRTFYLNLAQITLILLISAYFCIIQAIFTYFH
jgi:hypothetical protein